MIPLILRNYVANNIIKIKYNEEAQQASTHLFYNNYLLKKYKKGETITEKRNTKN